MEKEKEPPKLGEGLIPTLFRKWRIRKRLSTKQKAELDKIEKEAYFNKAKEVAKRDAIKQAEKDYE